MIADCCVSREIKYIRSYLRKYFLKFNLNIVYRITDIMYQIMKREASSAIKYTKGHEHDANFFGVQDSYFTTAILYVFSFMTPVIYCYKSSFFQIITPIYIIPTNLIYCTSHSYFIP